MTTEIKCPVLPESVADATVLTWHKQEGDAVARDETLVELETDKVVLEVPATEDGVLKKISKPEGETVSAEEVIGLIEAGAVAAKPTKVESTSATEKTPANNGAGATPVASSTHHADHSDFSPSVRRAANVLDVDPSQVSGTGKKGRVTKQDLRTPQIQSTHNVNNDTNDVAGIAILGERTEKRVPMSRLRARVAERLLNAQHNAAILTTFNEVNLHSIMQIRKQYKESFEKKHGVRLGLMSFFTKACAEALKRFPSVNASIDGDEIVYHGYYDIGIAVSTERGLVVPIVRDVDKLSLAQIEKAVAHYAAKARNNKITVEDMTGGTFTITNGGVFGSLFATPIINPPQTAILGMQTIQQRPVAENGEVVIRPMMYVALSYDHRMIDGKDSVQFLMTVKKLLEDPTTLLLEL